MSSTAPTIGFDRHLELNWLDAVASWAVAGDSEAEIKEHFADLLATIDQGDAANRKNRTLLTAVWLRVPAGLEGFHSGGLDLFQSASPGERIAVHYGRCMVAYPFFAFVATQVGRLLALQGDVSSSDVYRRVKERYGDRSRVRRSAQHVLSTLSAWGILDSTGPGRSTVKATIPVDDTRLIAWLVEAQLQSLEPSSCRFVSLPGHPVLFPFRLRPVMTGELLRANPRLDAVQQGLGDELIVLHQ